jgi:hypothetical protein
VYRVEISARRPDGYPDDKVRNVTGNTRTLKLETFEFEDQRLQTEHLTVKMAIMRTPHRHRPRKLDQLEPAADADLAALAERVTYVISPEHKDYLTSAGPGRLRSDASACPRGLSFDKVFQWLRAAVRDGQLSAQTEGDFPRYAGRRIEGQVYEARLSNSGLGQYKGYPIDDGEAPGWLS